MCASRHTYKLVISLQNKVNGKEMGKMYSKKHTFYRNCKLGIALDDWMETRKKIWNTSVSTY